MIIGLTGKAGSGKDTLANMIYDNDPLLTIIRSFAEPIKDIARTYLGLSKEDVNTQEGKSKYNEFWEMTNREILQKIGTDCFRKGFRDDIWTKLMEIEIQIFLESPTLYMIIPDVRFNNEAELIKKYNGIIINIERDSYIKLNHESENGIYPKFIDYTIENNDSKESLYNKFDKILKELECQKN